jgi:hypothetical protein
MFDYKLKTALLTGVIATNLFGAAAFASPKTKAKPAEEAAKPEIALATTETKLESSEDTKTTKQKSDRDDLKKSVSRYVADFYVSAY